MSEPIKFDLFLERHPQFTKGQIRWARFNSKPESKSKDRESKNISIYKPFADVFVQFGRDLLIDEERFFVALRESNEIRRGLS